MLTEEQQLEYLEGNGGNCPYCGKQGGMMHFFPKLNVSLQEGMIYLRNACAGCGKEWVDMFTLVGVMDESELPNDH